MKRDIGDVIDRWSIAKLKAERIGSEESKAEFAAFESEVCSHRVTEENREVFVMWCKMMYDINDFIWQLEAGLKSGKEKLPVPNYVLDEANTAALAKIGLTSLLIRNFNHIRVAHKNTINKIAGEGFQDTKKDHLS